MLGEPIGEGRGKVTGMRVLRGDGPAPQVEVSFQATGKLLGIEVTEMGTYWSNARPEGYMIGEGQGVVMTADGEMATWKGQGVGRPTGKGTGARWRGALFYETASRNLARLNGLAVVFEYETDENGNTQAKLWEWK